MANRVSVEIDARVEGFQQGMNQATESAQKYETETRKVADATGNFRKELAKAKKDVQNLALGYSQLSKEAKASSFGQEMKKQLDEAKEAAAAYIDMQGDLQQELRNLASDTHTLDMLAEGMGTIGDVTSATLGIIAQFTGNEKDAQRAIVAFTTAQSALGAITKIQNALQMQSNTMMAVSKVQTLAAAAATNIKTAAEGKGIIATKAATVAQAAFNTVAYMNPYVLLAMAIVGVVAALATFIAFTGKAEDAQEAENQAAERAKNIKSAYYDTYNQKLSETMGNYTKLQTEWKNLKSEGERNEWIKDNTDAFHALGYEINDTADAETFFVQNESKVIASFVARAEAAALAAQQVEIFNQALRDMPQAGDVKSAEWFAQNGLSTKGRRDKNQGFLRFEYQYEVNEEDLRQVQEQRLKIAREQATKLGELQLQAEKKANATAAEVGVKEYKKKRNAALKKGGTTTKHKVEVEIEQGSLQESENKLKKLEEQRVKMSIDNPDLPKVKKQIEDMKKEIQAKKIKLGLEAEKTNTDLLSDFEKKLQQAVKNAEGDYMMAYLNGQNEKLEELWANWEKAIKARDNYNAAKELQSPEEKGGVTKTAKEDLNVALKGNPKQSIEGISNAISVLENQLKSIDWSQGIEEGAVSMQEYIDKIVEYKDQLATMQADFDDQTATSAEKAQKKAEKLSKTYNDVADACGSIGDAFSALSQLADDDPALNIMGIVAQAVAQMFAGYAQATAQAASMGPWAWVAFAAAGLAQTLAIVAQIKQAASFAEGGIVGGSSYSGDRLYARVNSGEMMLNSRQQRNLFNLLDSDVMPQKGGQQVQVSGVIRGTDLLLVQKNTNKVRSKTGTQINF